MAEDEAEGTGGATSLGVRVYAEDFGLDGPQGQVFRNIRVDAAPGSLIAIEGPSGSGRTCLLLALTGRMKSSSGHAVIGRQRLPKQLAAVRRFSALGPVPGVTDLDPALTVAEQLRERALLQRRFTGSVRALLRPRRERAAASRALLDNALAAAGLELDTLPKGQRTRVRDLERLEELRLSVALALVDRPRLLAVDDTDLKLSAEERELAWAMLRSIADAGTTVLAVCSDAPEDAVVIHTGRAAPEETEHTTQGGEFTALEQSTNGDVEGPGTAGQGGTSGDETTAKDGKKGEAADALAETGRA